MGIPKIPYVELLLRAMHARGGEIKRRDIIVDMFSRNWSRARIDGLLADRHLAGLIEVSREPMRGARRKSTRYRLTAHGWAAANRIVNQPPPRWNREEIARQFNLLVAEGDSWATELTRQAARGRDAEAQEQRKQQAAREAREKARDAVPQHPSKGRKRSQRDIEQRAIWAASKGFGPKVQAESEPVSVTRDLLRTVPAMPVAPIPRAPVAVQPQSPKASATGADDNKDWWKYASVGPPRSVPPALRVDPKEAAKTDALIARIAQAGYQTKNGLILYDHRWVTPGEWLERMPHALDR